MRRPVRVAAIRTAGDALQVEPVDGAAWAARAVISATGTWAHPCIPDIPGRGSFAGRQIHSAAYRRPEDFAGLRVLVVGGGNSGAQILAEVSRLAASATWVTEREPAFLPDEVDGRVLFERATARWQAEREGRPPPRLQGGLGDVVAVAPVREARARGALGSLRAFARLEARCRGLGGWDAHRGGRDHLVHRLPPGARPPGAARPGAAGWPRGGRAGGARPGRAAALAARLWRLDRLGLGHPGGHHPARRGTRCRGWSRRSADPERSCKRHPTSASFD